MIEGPNICRNTQLTHQNEAVVLGSISRTKMLLRTNRILIYYSSCICNRIANETYINLFVEDPPATISIMYSLFLKPALPNIYNPLTPSANPVSKVSKSAITPTRTTLRINSTARIKAANAPVKGFKKINNPARPRIATAAVTVAKISTMIKARIAPTAINWRFSLGSARVERSMSRLVSTSRRSERLDVALTGGRFLISPVVEVTAAVMRLICSPTLAVAAVLSRREDEGDRGARVASRFLVSSGQGRRLKVE